MKKLNFILLLLLSIFTQLDAQVTNGLVAHYPLDGGTATDLINANNGVVTGATATTDRFGNPNSAYSFDGNDYINIAHTANISLDNQNVITISFWVNQATFTSGLKGIVTKWGTASNEQYGIWANNNDCLTSMRTVNNSGMNDASNMTAGQWHHVVASWDKIAKKYMIYVDNVPTINITFTGNYANTSSNTSLGIGAQMNGLNSPNRFFNGKIDDVRIYNRVLSALDIDSLYSNNVATPIADIDLGLVAHYPFCTNADDEISANNGVVNGATLTTDRFGNPNSAYNFDGNDYINIAHTANISLDNQNAITISTWVYQTTFTAGLKGVVTKWGTASNEQYGLWANNNDCFISMRTVNNSGVNDASNMTAGQWHHVVASWDKIAKKYMIYVDNVLTLNTTFGGNYANTSSNTSLGIGAQMNGLNSPNRFFNGKIDDVRIYNRALSAIDIDSLFNHVDDCSILPINKVGNNEVQPLEIFPNPAENYIQIKNWKTDWAHIRIISLQGQVLLSQEIETNKINTSTLHTGIYFLQIFNTEGKLEGTQSFIKK